MDPKLSTLDPKLQDAYNRVMSGPISAPTPTQPPAAAQTAPQQPQVQQPQVAQAPIEPQPIAQPTVPEVTPAAPVETAPAPTATVQDSAFGSTIAFNANNTNKNQGTTVVKKGGSKIVNLLVGVGIIVLLVVYTFVWVKVFNLKLPFLS